MKRLVAIGALALVALAGSTCAPPPYPQATAMVPPAEYGSTATSVSSLPAFQAGANYVNTTSPDGATRFVCADGTTRAGQHVPPHTTPPC